MIFKLPSEKTTYTVVEAHDLESFIRKVYNQEFSFVDDQDCSDEGTMYSFNVRKNALAPTDHDTIDEFLACGSGNYLARYLLNDLCDKGFIEPGDYLINVPEYG